MMLSMKLKKYVKKNKIRQRDYKEKLGVSVPTAWRLLNRPEWVPDVKTAILVEKATKGAVTRFDILSEGKWGGRE